MPASLSSEAKISNKARQLRCAISVLASLSAVVSNSRLAQALSGIKALDQRDAEKILQFLDEMEQLQREVNVPIDWKRIDDAQYALTLRKLRRIQEELESEEKE